MDSVPGGRNTGIPANKDSCCLLGFRCCSPLSIAGTVRRWAYPIVGVLPVSACAPASTRCCPVQHSGMFQASSYAGGGVFFSRANELQACARPRAVRPSPWSCAIL